MAEKSRKGWGQHRRVLYPFSAFIARCIIRRGRGCSYVTTAHHKTTLGCKSSSHNMPDSLLVRQRAYSLQHTWLTVYTYRFYTHKNNIYEQHLCNSKESLADLNTYSDIWYDALDGGSHLCRDFIYKEHRKRRTNLPAPSGIRNRNLNVRAVQNVRASERLPGSVRTSSDIYISDVCIGLH